MYNKNMETQYQQITGEQLLKEYSHSVTNNNNNRMDVYKRYSKTANKTLTNFANEMSELLKESMEHMDCLNLIVRGVCDKSKHPPQQQTTECQSVDHEGDRGGLLKYKHILKQDFNAPIPAYTVINKPIVAETPKCEGSQLLLRKNNQELAQQLQDMKQSGDSNKKVIGVSKKRSIVLLEIKRNKTNDSLASLRYNQEKTIMETIKKQHKLLTSNEKKSSSKEELDGKSTSENLENRVKARKQKKYKRKIKKKSKEETLGKPLVVKTDGNVQLDDSNMEIKAGAKYTKLSRKYANENFHKILSKEPLPVTEGDQYGGKKIKIQSDNKQDWSVIMHTQKTTKPPENKINTFRIANILETITLKELEPLKAEYPRKDHIMESDIKIENSLLYDLVTRNTKSLELLVDINNLQANKMRRATPVILSSNSSRILIDEDEMESLKKFTMFTGPQRGVLKEVKHKLKKGKASKEKKHMKENELSHKTAISMKEYQMYRQLTEKGTKSKLKKYMTDPVRSYNQEIIAMPVLVDFHKELLPDISEVNSKETVVPEDILKPYIYTNISLPLHKATTAVMTVTVPNVDDMNKRLLEPNKPVVKAATEPSVLVQRVINCKQPKTAQLAKYTSRSPTTDGSQLISFIVKKEKQNTVDTLYTPSKGSHCKKSSVTEKVPPKRTIKVSRTKAKTSDLKAAIDGMEQKIKEIIDQPEMRNSAIMQNMEQEMKKILMQMQIDIDTPDFSVASSSTNSSIYGLDRGKSLLKSKTNLEGRSKLNVNSAQSKKSRAQSIKPVQQQTPSTSTTSYTTTHKESTLKLMKTLESKKIQTKSTFKDIKVIKADKRPIPDKLKIKHVPIQQESMMNELKYKPVQLDMGNIQHDYSIIELKKPPRSPRLSSELHIIMAPERDYNNLKKAKVENQDSICTSIKFTTPHTDISIPKNDSSEKPADLNMIFTKDKKRQSIELNKNSKKETKEIAKQPGSDQSKKELGEIHHRKSVNSKILDKWQTLEHPSMLQINNEVCTDEIQEVLERPETPKIIEKVKNDTKPKKSTKEKISDHQLIPKTEQEVKNDTKLEVLDNEIVPKMKQEVKNITTPDAILENNNISQEAKNDIQSTISNHQKVSTIDQDIKSDKQPEISKDLTESNTNEVVAEERKQNVFDQTIIPNVQEAIKKEEDVSVMKQAILQKEDSVSKIRPVTADVIVDVKKPVEQIAKINTEKNLLELRKKLDEESKGLCNDVNQVLHKIQEQNLVHLNVLKATEGSNPNIKMQRIRSEEFWTPFMHAVKKFRKEEPGENFYEFMKSKGHIRESSQLIRHTASINCVASELYISQKKMHVIYRDWTDSDLNVQKMDTDSSPEHSLRGTPTKKCLRKMTYHERLSEIAKRRLDLIKVESVKQFPQQAVVAQTMELLPNMKSKCVQFDEKSLQKVMGKIVTETKLQLELTNPECWKYDKFLIYLYGLMFMTIFCGLNLKYSCS